MTNSDAGILELELEKVQSLLTKAIGGFVCMKKTSSEIKFRSPRFVWCNGNKEICWAKGREKNDTKVRNFENFEASAIFSKRFGNF